ncbi:MAG: hydroxysqualene dehydroxylase HpnE [Pseudomonadota bacterium]|nr:hydroxysqualene dehydroxylase HpnE [Pseudomonadota bacterium]
MPTVHIIGAGLSGLAAAAALAERGIKSVVYDAAGHAGGRCRSFYDRTLDRTIDNGNHLIMSGNRHALDYLKRVGAKDPLIGPEDASYPFVDIKTGERWTVRINDGPIPFWAFDKKARVPGTNLLDYVKAAGIALAKPHQTVADVVDAKSLLYARFWEPLTLAALNTTPQIGQGKLLWSVIRETFLLGGEASRPLVAREGLGPSFIDPAVAYLASRGAAVLLNRRLRALWIDNGCVTSLDFPEGKVDVNDGDEVILAVPPSRLKQLMPELDPPDDNASILNVHYRTPAPVPPEKLGGSPFIGMVSSDAQWVFVRDDVVSLTVSASHAIGMDEVPNAKVVDDLWRETQIGLGLGDTPYEAVRVIRERRATPDQSPAGAAKRLKAETKVANLTLAGDHTDTGVPATIEGSIRSGDKAAGVVAGRML